MLDEGGASCLRGRVGEFGAERSDVAGDLVEVDVADHHADAGAVERLVDRHLLLNGARAADAEDLDGVTDVGEAVLAGHLGSPRLDVTALDPDRRAARASGQVRGVEGPAT